MNKIYYYILLFLGLLIGKPQFVSAQFDQDSLGYWIRYDQQDELLGATDTSINTFDAPLTFRSYEGWNAGGLLLESQSYASWGKAPSGNEPFGTMTVEDERMGLAYSLFNRPVSRAYYHFGNRNEQMFLIEHHQPISNRSQIDLSWAKGTSNGLLLNGREDFYNFNIQALNRLYKNNIYLKLNFQNQSIAKRLLGKIDDLQVDTLLNQGAAVDFESLSEVLNANINNRKISASGSLYLFLNHWNDSTANFHLNRPYLKYQFDYQRYKLYFDNAIPDSNGFYPNNFLNTDKSFEFYTTHYLKHDLSLAYVLDKKVKLKTEFIAKYYQYFDQAQLFQNSINPDFTAYNDLWENYGFGVNLDLIFKDIQWNSRNVYTLIGINANNYQLKQHLKYEHNEQIVIGIKSLFDRNSGNTYWEVWRSNHFQVDTALPLANYGHHEFYLDLNPVSWTHSQLSVAYHLEEDQRYLDTNFQMALRDYEVIPFNLNQTFKFKGWEFSFGGSYFLKQDTAGPAYIGKGSFAYQNNLWFKGNLKMRFQIDYTYIPEHQLRLFEPLSRNYTDYFSRKVSDNHFLNFTLFAGIGKARVFVGVDNILAGIGGRYFHQASLGQFYPNRTFRVGIDWRFDY